jgi:hypothetical protein
MAHRQTNLIFALVIVAYCFYAGLFIYSTSFFIEKNSYVPEGKRYFVLFDDAMVSMRYAKNFAEGHGLVWNPGGGERVEGYTNLLWVLYMALFHRLMIDPAQVSFYIQTSGAVFLIANLVLVKKITDLLSGTSGFAALTAVAFTAFYLPLNNWSLQGTEVSILTLLLTAATWKALENLQTNRFSIWPYILLGFSTLVRLDMVVPFLALMVFMAASCRKTRLKHLVLGSLVLLAFIIPQEVFRLWYYHDLLPNTYYLKMAGYPLVSRVLRGLEVTSEFLIKFGAVPFAILLFRRDRPVRLLIWLFLCQVLYSIYVGGDAWEWYGGSNRYIAIAMPALFILFALTLHRFYLSLRQILTQTPDFKLNLKFLNYGIAIFGAVSFLTYNSTHGVGTLAEWLLLKPQMYVPDNEQWVRRGLLIRAVTTEQAKIAVVVAGVTPYFADRPAVDFLGKSDRVIAHLPMRTDDPIFFFPGHMKYDYDYSIGELKPDIVVSLWGRTDAARKYLESDYTEVWLVDSNVYMLKDSPNILWERLR